MSYLTARQAEILQLLTDGKPRANRQIIKEIGLAENGSIATNIGYNMDELVEKEFVEVVAGRTGKYGRTIEISDYGREFLARWNRAMNVVYVKPEPRINIMAQPVYKPSKPGYVRNNGTGHIPSLGATCRPS